MSRLIEASFFVIMVNWCNHFEDVVSGVGRRSIYNVLLKSSTASHLLTQTKH